MQHKQSQLHAVILNIDDQDALKTRAKGLARLLIYATHDALELGGDDIAATLVGAIESLKTQYKLEDKDILPPARGGMN
ncbi:hypothetical protein [Hyphomicrobium sp. LHD-15]|uniref:hypothetical protein n=1 Tax=Hyphomicrobium sp. LHD-15 TaxID=3072142 RepID=UPI00280FE9E0|nr:hypothetical protein [Hyphomicrobium sp. LHD-15]MDQ8700596.1 hypothetical protein [Hyphomicrobium sp. LHD-15]